MECRLSLSASVWDDLVDLMKSQDTSFLSWHGALMKERPMLLVVTTKPARYTSLFSVSLCVLSFFYSFGFSWKISSKIQAFKLSFLKRSLPFQCLHSHKKGRCLNYFYRGLEYYYYGTKADSVLVGPGSRAGIGGGLKPREDNFIQNIIITTVTYEL